MKSANEYRSDGTEADREITIKIPVIRGVPCIKCGKFMSRSLGFTNGSEMFICGNGHDYEHLTVEPKELRMQESDLVGLLLAWHYCNLPQAIEFIRTGKIEVTKDRSKLEFVAPHYYKRFAYNEEKGCHLAWYELTCEKDGSSIGTLITDKHIQKAIEGHEKHHCETNPNRDNKPNIEMLEAELLDGILTQDMYDNLMREMAQQ